DGRGSLYAAGFTESPDFPVRKALQNKLQGKSDAFLARIRVPEFDVQHSTFLGGSGDDAAWAVAADRFGVPHVSGTTSSIDLRVTEGALRARNAGGKSDAFVCKLDASGTKLIYSTYFGGSGEDSAGYDGGSLKIDRAGNAWLAGFTTSVDLPVSRHRKSAFAGGDTDGYIAAITANGSSLHFGSYFGGDDRDLLEGLVLPVNGSVWAVGLTASRNLPATGALQPKHGGARFDAMIVQFSAGR
ncbi:MAG: SBBP repeat-containing protein, partial [Bryobacteraceae bacterium]